MQIIGGPIDAVEVKVLTSQTHTHKLGRVWTRRDENLGDNLWLLVYFFL